MIPPNPPSPVTIVVNGSIVSSVQPAHIAGGRVIVPLAPIVVRLVTRSAYLAGARIVRLERDGVRIVVPVVAVENDMPFIELAPVVRRFGGAAVFDGPTKTLAIVLSSGGEISTPPPYSPAPMQSSVPGPSVPTAAPIVPGAVQTSIPRPRRTAIPAIPSEPIVASPQPGVTDPHR